NMVIGMIVTYIFSDDPLITTNGVQLTMSNTQERVDSPCGYGSVVTVKSIDSCIKELASPKANGSCAVSTKLDITSTSSDSPLIGVNTPRSDEDRLEILELTVFMLQQFCNTVTVKQFTDITRLQALVKRKKVVISKAIIRDVLRLDDAKGVACLPNEEIFTGLDRIGSAMASAVICLSTGRKFNFSKYVFDSLVRNVDSSSKFYMYPRFNQLIIQNQLGDLSTHTTKYTSPALTQKVFANMRRVGKGFSRFETPLFEGMLVFRENVVEGIADEQVQDDVVVVAAPDGVTAAVEEDIQAQSVPSPSPPPQDLPSTSQMHYTLPSSPQLQPQTQPQAGDFLLSLLQTALDTCAALTSRIEQLKSHKLSQALEITQLKKRVKRLEKSQKVKVFKLKRLKKVKENQKNDKIRSKPDKNEKRGEAGKSLKQLQWVEQEKLSKTHKEWPKMQIQSKAIQVIKKEEIVKGFFVVDTLLFEGMLVAQEVGKVADEGDAEVNVDYVPAVGVAAEGVVSAANDEVPTADDEPSIPSPTPPTPPPQSSQDVPSTSQIAQSLEITKLKSRVKKLERRNKASKLKRLKKVGSAQRIDTSDDTVMDDGRTAESQAQIYQIDLEHANKVLSMQDEEKSKLVELQEVVDVVTTAKIIIEVVTTAIEGEKGVVIRDPQETTTTSTIIHSEAKSKHKGKGILVEEPKPLKKQAQIKQDEAYVRELEAELNKNID
nr:hypothetical protein [Tanacetum cinerariifolium]